ncbi:hypothetical protein C0J26_29640 [Pseudomonas baetica]|nr:hypothetical protein C0J26_29640 [Pseudomonas baetica]
MRHRVVASAREGHTRLYLESPKNSFGVRVRQARFDPQTKLYTFTTEGLIPITLTWTPDSPPGGELLNSTDLPATDPGIRIYPGARVTLIEGRVDEHPSCDFDNPDDYILEFPIESGIESIVSGQRTHLQKSGIKGDGVRLFLSGRDHPYRQDFHAPTKLLSQTLQGPGCAGMPETRCLSFQRRHQPRHQCQRDSQVAADLP